MGREGRKKATRAGFASLVCNSVFSSISVFLAIVDQQRKPCFIAVGRQN